jgi:hypothetical protein
LGSGGDTPWNSFTSYCARARKKIRSISEMFVFVISA